MLLVGRTSAPSTYLSLANVTTETHGCALWSSEETPGWCDTGNLTLDYTCRKTPDCINCFTSINKRDLTSSDVLEKLCFGKLLLFIVVDCNYDIILMLRLIMLLLTQLLLPLVLLVLLRLLLLLLKLFINVLSKYAIQIMVILMIILIAIIYDDYW